LLYNIISKYTKKNLGGLFVFHNAPSCFTSVSPLKFWQVFTKTRAALGYGLVHPYFGNALNLRLYPLPSPQIKLLQAITACCME
jgi:hypothetical protein